MKKIILLSVSAIVILSSCSQKILVQDAYQIDSEETFSESRVDVKTQYAGDGLQYVTFQVDVDNRSEDSIFLSSGNIVLDISNGSRRTTKLAPLRKYDIIRSLEQENNNLESEKKTNTAANIILGGAGILTGILAGGSAPENIIYGAGTAVDVLDQRQRYGAAQGSIEDQIIYHEEYTLDEVVVAPGRTASYDIHFERLLIGGPADLRIKINGEEHVTNYEFEVNEVRVRR